MDPIASGSGEEDVDPPPSSNLPPPVYEEYPDRMYYGNLSCEYYRSGGLCEQVIPRGLPVLTNFTRGPQLQVKNDLDRIFYVLDRFGSTNYCFREAVKILCHFTFPYCDPAYKPVVYQPICQRDCRVMRDFICPGEWEQMNNLQSVIDFGTIDTFNCELLAPAEAGELPMCIGTLEVDGGAIPRAVLSGKDCYTGNGRGYAGTVNVTMSGYTCQQWTLPPTYPHQHYLFPQVYPELLGDHNYCRNPGDKGERPWCFTTNRTKRWEYCDIEQCVPGPVCERYSGSLCRGYGTIGLDYIFINKSVGNQVDYEAQLEKLSDTLMNFEDCQNSMMELVCHVNYPSCDMSNSSPTPRKVCRTYCNRVKRLCGDFYNHFYNFLSVAGLPPLTIPVCDEADSDTVHGGDNPECYMPIEDQLPIATNASTKCYDTASNGSEYNGVVNTTVSGVSCQHWDAQLPHPHPFTSLFRKYLEGHNYCRNPDGRGFKPWCYTVNESLRWEYCDIEECEDSDANEVSSDQPLLSDTVVWIIIGGGVALVLFILLVITLCLVACGVRAKSKSKTVDLSSGYSNEMKSMAAGVYNDYSGSNGGGKGASQLINDTELTEYLNGSSLPMIKRDQLVYLCDLGEGHFGKVLKAEALDIASAGADKITVAVKVLKEGTSHSARKEFFREACLMNSYNHKNIVRLLGVCIMEEPLCMVFEYMEMGDLHSFLRQNAPAHTFSFPQSGPKTLPNGLGIEQMVSMSIDISAGLSYLSNHHYIHRDLATRNCLVDSSLCVKISDFGMSQDIYVSDYFRLGDSEMLPVRWMPPEAIMYSTFSIESDVWSFGVVLWEIFSFGMQPYYGMSNEEVVQYVKNCKVLKQPDRCPQEIYDLMVDCWTVDPKERPKANEIYEGLKRWTPELSAAVKSQTKEQPEYQNMSVILQLAAANSTPNYMLLEEPADEEPADCSPIINGEYDKLAPRD